MSMGDSFKYLAGSRCAPQLLYTEHPSATLECTPFSTLPPPLFTPPFHAPYPTLLPSRPLTPNPVEIVFFLHPYP